MNWGQIKAVVRQYLENDETTFVANLPLYARLAEEDVYRQAKLPPVRELSTSTVIAGDRYITPPDGMLSVYSFSLVNSVTGAFSFMLPKDLSYLNEAYPNPSETGQPRFYCWRDEEALLIAPTPDQNYGLEMHYFRQPVSVSLNDVDTNETWLSTFGENCIIFGTIYHGYINEKGDQDVVQLYKAQFDKGIADLKLISEGRQRTDNYRTPL